MKTPTRSAASKFACLIWLFVSGASDLSQAAEHEAITLPWTERKPYQYIDGNGKLKGILFDLGETIFARAAIPMKWAEVPANRIVLQLKQNQTPLCLVGWFKTAEREQLARLTLPIYQDQPLRGLVRADSNIRQGMAITELASATDIHVLVKQGYSYGDSIDALFATRRSKNVHKVAADHTKMIHMIKLGRADIMFLPQEEIDFYAMGDAAFRKDFSIIQFDELAEGNFRHIICSKKVSQANIEKLNQAIAATVKQK